MKLQQELKFVEDSFIELSRKNDLQAYVDAVRESGNYHNLEVRVANDFMRAAVGSSKMCEWYEKYDCNDSHITTLAKTALKKLNLNI